MLRSRLLSQRPQVVLTISMWAPTKRWRANSLMR
ncbi:Uncharacterised protein [Vibrio cholerae]|nr:Uncharacterised protein [Vibrio cholerae]